MVETALESFNLPCDTFVQQEVAYFLQIVLHIISGEPLLRTSLNKLFSLVPWHYKGDAQVLKWAALEG